MTDRISDERLEQMIFHRDADDPVLTALRELKQSRALISKLRELAERKKVALAAGSNLTMNFPYAYGRHAATSEFLSDLDSLLSAHDKPQSADGSEG